MLTVTAVAQHIAAGQDFRRIGGPSSRAGASGARRVDYAR
jgi:hypothetical protein